MNSTNHPLNNWCKTNHNNNLSQVINNNNNLATHKCLSQEQNQVKDQTLRTHIHNPSNLDNTSNALESKISGLKIVTNTIGKKTNF